MDKDYENRKDDVFSTAFAFTIIIGLAFLVSALFSGTLSLLCFSEARNTIHWSVFFSSSW